jgi:hypothetical protein
LSNGHYIEYEKKRAGLRASRSGLLLATAKEKGLAADEALTG